MIAIARKRDVLKKITSLKQKADLYAVELRLQGKTKEADQAEKRAKRIEALNRKLITQLMSQWRGTADKVIEDIAIINAAVQRSIAAVRSAKATANNIAKGIALLDDAVSLVSGILIP